MKENFIIHQKARQYEWSGECFLSIKSFSQGVANYRVNQRKYEVNPKNFLILNDCTSYNLLIDSERPTESFCVFFSPKFVSKTISELFACDKQILDFNTKQREGIRLFERIYPNKGYLAFLLKKGIKKIELGMESLEENEYYHDLFLAILRQNKSTVFQAKKLSSQKQSTRKEIYQRICFAKDYLDANYYMDIKLSDLSRVALLSENHLIRNFKEVHGLTPFQYLSQIRMKEAKKRILETNKAIKAIAMEVGYTSIGNFSNYFKRLEGMSPSCLRKGDL